MNLDLKSKNALVCGSTQGIGKASAIEISKLGTNVTLVARDENKLKEVIKELDTTKSQTHNYIIADFTKPAELKKKIEAHVKKNIVHILVNNTGGPAGGPVLDAKEEEFTQAFSNH